MSNALIFRDPNAGPLIEQGLSELAKSIVSGNSLRAIKTNTNGTFKRFINGEQVGKAIRGSFDAIIVNYLPKVSRTFYEAAYDPNATPTLPDCWSNLGDYPDAGASNPQSASCDKCPQNIKGSGDNGGRACRFNRRIAILLSGDDSGDVYQLNVPAMSLFGKGNGNVHPFESYINYLVANKTSPDYVVTTIEYNLDADTMQLQFSPLRPIDEDEKDLVIAAQCDPETMRYIQLTVAASDGVTTLPAGAQTQTSTAVATTTKPKSALVAAAQAAATAAADEDEPADEPAEEIVIEKKPVPTKTRRKAREPEPEPETTVVPIKGKSAFDAEGDDDEDEAPAPARTRGTPTRRAAPKPTAPVVAAKGELVDIISSWDEEDEGAEEAAE